MATPSDDSYLLDTATACAMLCISTSSLHRLIRGGALKALKAGRKTLIRRADLIAWAESQPSARGSEERI